MKHLFLSEILDETYRRNRCGPVVLKLPIELAPIRIIDLFVKPNLMQSVEIDMWREEEQAASSAEPARMLTDIHFQLNVPIRIQLN